MVSFVSDQIDSISQAEQVNSWGPGGPQKGSVDIRQSSGKGSESGAS